MRPSHLLAVPALWAALRPAAALAQAEVPDPDLAGMPSAAPAAEMGAPPPEPVRFGAALTTRVDADLADDRPGEDAYELRLRLDLSLAARLSPKTQAALAGRLSYDARGAAGDWPGRPDRRAPRAAHAAELGEARLSYADGDMSVDVGNLYLRWGALDASAPTDVLNPQDLRDPAPVAFEAPVLPVPAARLGVARGAAGFELCVLPFFEPHRVALSGTDWAPTPPGQDNPTFSALTGNLGLVFSTAAEDDVQPLLVAPQPPDESAANVSFGARASYAGAGFDAHLVAAHTWDRIPEIAFDPALAALLAAAQTGEPAAILAAYPAARPALEAGGPLFTSRYHRLDVVGGDVSATAGPVVLKAEAAYSLARTLYREDLSARRPGSLTWGVAADYAPDEDLALTFELFGLRPDERGPWLYLGRQLVQAVGHAEIALVSERLALELTAQAGLLRFEHTLAPALRYQPADGHTLTAGVYLLGGESGTLGHLYAANDAAFLRYTLRP